MVPLLVPPLSPYSSAPPLRRRETALDDHVIDRLASSLPLQPVSKKSSAVAAEWLRGSFNSEWGEGKRGEQQSVIIHSCCKSLEGGMKTNNYSALRKSPLPRGSQEGLSGEDGEEKKGGGGGGVGRP